MTWQHGTLTGYGKCNGGGRLACTDCRAANTSHQGVIRRRQAYGQTGPKDRLDPTLTIQALQHFSNVGHSVSAIEHVTGLPNQQVYRLLKGDVAWVFRDTQERALAGLGWLLRHPSWKQHQPRIDSRHATQQLRSLSALGWELKWLTHQIGYQRDVPGFGPTIRVEVAHRVQDLYDRLGGTKGPSKRAADHARRLGWHVPLAYDDDGRLIPEAIPNALSELRERREDRQARVDLIAQLTDQGLSSRQIAERLGIADRTVTRDRSRRTA